jgi:hypothetical protein
MIVAFGEADRTEIYTLYNKQKMTAAIRMANYAGLIMCNVREEK